MGEKIVEVKSCRECRCSFSITNKDLYFYKKISPKIGEECFDIPSPSICPECRQKIRLAFRNERKLYNRQCDATGSMVISVYSPDKNYLVYNKEYWNSDKFDPLAYGKKINGSETFFEQFRKLYLSFPKYALFSSSSNDNSPFTNYASYMKDSHLIFDSMSTEKSLYGTKVSQCKYCIDCTNTLYSEQCYECNDITKCYKVFHSSFCNNSNELYFCSDCNGCEECLLSFGLINKKYYIKNKQYTRVEYLKKKDTLLSTLSDSKITKLKEESCLFFKKQIHRNLNITGSESCLGNNISESVNSINCYDCQNIVDCKYSSNLFNAQDCYDHESWGDRTSLVNNCIAVGTKCNNIAFCIGTISSSSDIFYSSLISGSSHLFGCVGLRSKKYCIFNKQYTKEEYNKLVPKLIQKMQKDGEWGEFFPASFSPFGYNETVAQEYFPLTKEEALEKGFNWSDYEAPQPQVEKIISADRLPNDIKDIPDDILNWAVECEVTKKPFRIIPQELEFYKKHKLPVPRRHPDQRHLDRMKLRNPRKLFDRDCDNCGVSMKTTYAPEREETVYCEECYSSTL